MGDAQQAPGAAGGERTVDVAGGQQVSIGPLRPTHGRALFDLFAGVVERGEGFPQLAPLTEDDFDAAWGSGPTLVVAACHGDELVGAYYLRPNFPGRAGHIANAGYVVDPRCRVQPRPPALRGARLRGHRPGARRRRGRGRPRLLAGPWARLILSRI